MITVVLNNLRSIENVASIARSCEFFGINNIIAVGTTPFPGSKPGQLPHVEVKLKQKFAKISLTSTNINFSHMAKLEDVREDKNCLLIGIEQDISSLPIEEIQFISTSKNIYLVLGNEPSGIPKDEIKLLDRIYEIPKIGTKECLNVASASAIALYFASKIK